MFMMSIKTQIGVVALGFLLASCIPTPTMSPSIPLAVSDTPIAAIPTPIAPGTVPPATLQIFPSSTPAQVSQSGFQIISPLDETVVNVPQVEVIGTAPAGIVISINDEIVIVDVDGQFKITVSLEEGPNLIEIVASDDIGNETSVLLAITYEP